MQAMTKLHAYRNWYIKMFGNEHLPVHVHVHHPEGKAIIHLDGTTLNRGVPEAVLVLARAWVSANQTLIRDAWTRLDNLEKR